MDDELQNHRGPAAKRAELERCKSYFTRTTVMANERLGLLARFFDLRHDETGQRLPRPGKEACPESNAANIQDLFLNIASWREEARCPTPWPNMVYLWPNFEQSLWKGGVINDVPWAAAMPIVRNNTVFSDFAYKASNLSPARIFSHLQGSQLPPPRTLPAGDPLQQAHQSASSLRSRHRRSVRLPHQPKHSLLAEATGRSRRMKATEQNANPNNTARASRSLHFDSISESEYRGRGRLGERTHYRGDGLVPKARLNTGRLMPEAATLSTAKSEVSFDIEMHDADDSGLADADCESDPDYASPSPGFDNHQAADDDAMEENSDERYAVEALIDHRPPFSSRRNARAYKVRWAGDWPAAQKHSWEPFRNIAVHIVDDYWAGLETGKPRGRSRRTGGDRRRN
ncbi:hypothetical protein DL764_007680 [Monosporascus ibericus]|uniref:Chromo domain-containing protein n=1 Tax=Monosporascus ibericus TaxID=155417 RepID=A0A4Q4SZE2_9PEZI|nr:hypothetical protein DL764_007680 [Monosporascus ibericus]